MSNPTDRAHAEQRWPYPLPARVFALIIAGLAVMLVFGIGVGFAIGHGSESDVCRTAVRLLDSPNLLDPSNRTARRDYLAAHDECVRSG